MYGLEVLGILGLVLRPVCPSTFERIAHTAHTKQILHHVLSVLTVVMQYLKTWGQIFYSNCTNLGIVLFLWVFWA